MMIQGIAPENVLKITAPSTAVLLLMRRMATLRNPEARIRWSVYCKVAFAASADDLSKDPPLVSLLAYPPRRLPDEPYATVDELLLMPLLANLCAVAIAYYPLEVFFWRFDFFTDQRQDPDATAEVLALPIRTPSLGCGLFRTPFRGSQA